MSGKILILHLSRLGDMIQSLPAVRLLKEDRPDCSITYFGIEEFCRILERVPWIDRLVTIPWQDCGAVISEGGPAAAVAMDRLIGSHPELGETYDLLINLTHSWAGGYLAGRIGAAEKQGRLHAANDDLLIAGRWGKYLFAIAKNRKDNLLNIADLYMGMSGVGNRPAVPFLATMPETDARCLSRLMESGAGNGRKRIGFQLGASSADRMWPIEDYVRLGERIARDIGADIILFGSPKERPLADQFLSQSSFPAIDLVGATSLTELPSYLKAVDILVSNDTGPLHIAAAVGTRVVGIFLSIAFYSLTGPYGEGHVVIQPDHPCSPCLKSTLCARPLCRESISPDSVFEGVKLALGLDPAGSALGRDSSVFQSFFQENGVLGWRLANADRQGYPSWRRSSQHEKALVSQALWNTWLGIPEDRLPARPDPSLAKPDEYRKDAAWYRDLYRDGRRHCRMILAEYRKKKPDVARLQSHIDRLGSLDEALRHREGPLSILKDIHGYHFAECRMCRFPELARELSHQYEKLEQIVEGFIARLEKS